MQVTASLPGANPETMAAAVATPLERQFSTIDGLESMTSISTLGNTQITLTFSLRRAIKDVPSDIAQRETEALWRAHLRYDATARDPWCNTLQTVGFFNFEGQLAVPAGLGINETRQAAGMAPPKADHVLAKGPEALEAMAAWPALAPVVSGPDWILYRNTAAGCSDPGQDRK